MMAETSDTIYLSLSEIAEIAGVGASAVSNWRKRHEDFPAPRLQAAGGSLFALAEVERWLVENGKIDGRVPPGDLLWNIGDSMRGVWKPDELWNFMLSGLVYLVACRRGSDGDVRIAKTDRWESVREGNDDQLQGRLEEVSQRIEAKNPRLEGLLASGFRQAPAPARSVRQLLVALSGALDEEAGDVELFQELTTRMSRADRFSQEHATPDDLAMLMVRLAEPLGPVVTDLAAGNGGLLLLAGLAGARRGDHMELVGLDVSAEAIRYARAWFFIYDMKVDLRVADTLRTSWVELRTADTVLLDPPYGVGGWGDVDLYMDDRWTYGQPPPSSADFAWMQVAIGSLGPGGRAIVVQPPRTSFVGGKEGSIRTAMLEAGCIEAVIQLPDRLRRNTSIPLMVWVLRRPPAGAQADTSILLVDASDLGTTSRHETELEEREINLIVELVRRHRDGLTIPPEESGRAKQVLTSEVRDGVLTPSRYRDPAEGVDLDELQARVDELRARIADRVEDGRLALARLEDILEARR